MKTAKLFEKLTVNKVELKNRTAVAPMTRVTATADGLATSKMADYYASFAQGDFGLVITEGLYIDTEWSQTYSHQAGIATPKHAGAWRPIVDEVHKSGGKIIAQIQHSGALSQGNFHASGSVGPSAIRPKGEQMKFYRGEGQFPIPRELRSEEIRKVIESFAEAAEIAVKDAGFDGVEIHGANGYLLDQFFTDYTNSRTDEWGGEIANRLKLSLEVIKAVRLRVGADVAVGIRISQGKVNDFYHKWENKEADAKIVFELLSQSGVDFVHVTEFEAWQPAFPGSPHSLVTLANRYAPNLTIIANGSLHEPARAIEVLEQGADIVALGRGALSNHDWPKLVCGGKNLRDFDKSILGPIADIKDSELERK